MWLQHLFEGGIEKEIANIVMKLQCIWNGLHSKPIDEKRGVGINRHVVATSFRGRHCKGNREYCHEIAMYSKCTTQQADW